MPDKYYIVGGYDGWLNVLYEPTQVQTQLPEFLQIEFLNKKAGRDYFTALEGIEQGNKFSVVQGNIRKGSPSYRSAAMLEFSISKQKLTYAYGEAKAITSEKNPIELGIHPIQIPDFPHPKGNHYMPQSLYAKCWFFLSNGRAIKGKDDKYLHTGLRTAGCVTVDPNDWTKLYKYIILCRKGDGKNVGTIKVVS